MPHQYNDGTLSKCIEDIHANATCIINEPTPATKDEIESYLNNLSADLHALSQAIRNLAIHAYIATCPPLENTPNAKEIPDDPPHDPLPPSPYGPARPPSPSRVRRAYRTQ